MKTGAVVAYIAWQLVLAECARRIQLGENPHPSNIRLLIPVLVSGAKPANNDIDRDMPFSSIPSSAFILDEAASGLPPNRGHGNSYQLDEPRPRSLYLSGRESADKSSGRQSSSLQAELRRACSRYLQSAAFDHELLHILCSELLDVPPARCSCRCCAPAWARRDLMPVGGNSDWVLHYMRSAGKKPHPSMSKWSDD